jgi:hypothetical protein
VGWNEHLVRLDSPALQFAPTRDAHRVEEPVSRPEHFRLLPGDGISIFHLAAQTRAVWLIAIIAMHLAIGLAMGLYFFAFVMITLNLAAFGPEFSFGGSGASRREKSLRFLRFRLETGRPEEIPFLVDTGS